MLEEVEFYLTQGLRDEARDTLNDALEEHPDHPVLLARLDAIAGASLLPASKRSLQPPPAPKPSVQPAASVRPSSEPAGEDHSFELAQKLAEEVSQPATSSGAGQPIEVADVLAAFKKGVAKQIDLADSATHYDLGIAYMEMGLHNEAIDEFKLCLGDLARTCTAHMMIAMSYVARGDMEPGIEHFRLALGSKPTAEEEICVWFEMAAFSSRHALKRSRFRLA